VENPVNAPTPRHFPRSLRAVAFLALGLATVLAAACNQIPKRRGATVVESAAPRGALQEQNPNDVVVTAVIDESGNRACPTGILRSAFYECLVGRHYSPLALSFVDATVAEGDTYRPGTLREDAVLSVVIERWDTSFWETNSALELRAEARLLDARTMAVLWSGRVDDRYDFRHLRSRSATDLAFTQAACRELANEVLAALPPRKAAPTLP
jgi:hypothetical protein